MCGGAAEYDGVCYLHSCRHLGDVVSIEGAGGRTAEAVAGVVCGARGARGTREEADDAREHCADSP